jgi:hypothetical protein
MRNLIMNTALILLLIIALPGNLWAIIKATSVKGRVAYKTGRKWIPLKKGTILRQGTKISTGLRSRAVININGHILTIRPLSLIKINRSFASKKGSRTRIGMRRGSIRAMVKRGKRIKTVFKVSTPVATSSVRGTIEDVSYGPERGMVVRVIEGMILGEERNGSRRLIRGKQMFVQKSTKPVPDNILSDMKEKAVSSLFDKNLTEDEIASFDTNDDNIVDDNQSTTGSLDNATRQGRERPGINAGIQWP